MHVLLIPVGSSGDVHPFVGIGLELKARGHNVSVVTNSYFEPLIRRAGLGFIEYGTREQFEEVTRNPDVWHPRKGFETIVGFVLQGVRLLYDLIEEHATPGETLLVGGTLAFGARIAQEKRGYRLVSVHLQPSIFRSAHQAPYLPPMFMPDWLPPALKRAQWWLADTLMIDRVLGRGINQFRQELGLAPVRRLMQDWLHSPQLALGLFPDWYAPPQPDWPAQSRLVGFPLYDERGATDMPAQAQAFLDAGDQPLVFTPGSANQHGHAFFAAAVDACVRLNRRGLLLTRFPEQVPTRLPESVLHVPFIPFSQVLPRAAALVHHGGIGTLSQGLAAGIPQLIMPLSHDQPDNARRLQRMGVGAALAPSRFRGPALADRLRQLIDNPAVLARCRDYADRIAQQDGIAGACDALEETGQQQHVR